MCHNFLRVGVMIIQVYEELFCRIHLWSHILFLQPPVHEKHENHVFNPTYA